MSRVAIGHKDEKQGRAIIMVDMGDPFLIAYWLRNFRRYAHLIDRAYIRVTGEQPSEAREWLIKELGNEYKWPSIHFSYSSVTEDHGEAVKHVLDNYVCEKYVCLLESDTYILDPEFIEHNFSLLEDDEFDICGTFRGSCSDALHKIIWHRYKKVHPLPSPESVNLWPAPLFITTKILRKCSHFQSFNYTKGVYYDLLGAKVPVNCSGDTMVYASLELLALKPKVRIWPFVNYHANAYTDVVKINRGASDLVNKDGTPKKSIGFVHIGSLSSLLGGYVRTDDGVPFRYWGHPVENGLRSWSSFQDSLDSDGAWSIFHLISRLAHAKLFIKFFKKEYPGAISPLVRKYARGVSKVAERAKVTAHQLRRYQHIYENILEYDDYSWDKQTWKREV